MPENKDQLIDSFLCFMKLELEKRGLAIDQKGANFAFNLQGKDAAIFRQGVNISDEDFKCLINICNANEYINNKSYLEHPYDYVWLTKNGFARAASVEKAKNYNQYDSTIHITEFHAHNAQIGNNNALTQNFNITIENIITEIDKSDATHDEKEKAKNCVMQFFNNPLILAAVSGGASGAASFGITKLLGG